MTMFKTIRLSFNLLLLLLVAGCGEKTDSAAPDPRALEIRNASRLKKFSAGLELNTEQQTQFKTLIGEESEQVAKIHQEAARTGEDRVLRIVAAQKDTAEKMKKLLTSVQLEKFDAVLRKIDGKKAR